MRRTILQLMQIV